MTPKPPARPHAIDFHAHVIVPEVYAVAAEHNIFSELPVDPGVTDEMRNQVKGRAGTVLARMSDISERIAKMDAMGVDVQVLSASLVHQGLDWADAQISLRLARITNDWIAKAVAGNPERFVGLGTLPLHVPALAVTELERCMTMTDRMIDLVEEGFDLAVRNMLIPDSSLIVRRVATYRFVVCGAPGYFAARGMPKQPADLVHHNCLIYSHSAWGHEWRFAGPDGEQSITVSGNLQANSDNALRLAAVHVE